MRIVTLLCLASRLATATVFDILEHGAVPGSLNASGTNQAVLLNLIQNANSGDRVLVPREFAFYMQGGIYVSNVVNVTLDVQGSLVADSNTESWPRDGPAYAHFLHFIGCSGVTVTGTGGLLDGNGITWWNKEVLPQVFGHLNGSRPKLLRFHNSTDILVENLRMHNSPSFHLQLDDVARAEVRNITITVDRQHQQHLKRSMSGTKHLLPHLKLQPWDLNTDGIDPSGRDIWIHDCSILNDDDSIAVKPCNKKSLQSKCSENILIERMVMTGFGASIGSVPPSPDHNCVRNITFRQISMPQTGKGVYVKSNPECDGTNTGEISNILYEDIVIDQPRWWAIWIGPQQQHQPGQKLGDKCALDFPISKNCPTQGCVDFRNITLRNIQINQPWLSPGVILGNSSNPMSGVVFDNVTVTKPGRFPYAGKYLCESAEGTVTGSSPAPGCI